MTGNVQIANTTEARNHCATLDSSVTYYNNLVADLKNAKDKINANWEGDAAAISDVSTRIDQIIAVFESQLIPSMSGLSTSIVEFADEVDKLSNNTVEQQSENDAGNVVGGTLTGAGIGAAIGSIIPGIGTAIGAGVGAVIGGISGGVGAGVSNDTFEDSFWEKHGNNFVDAWTSRSWTDQWDYSECEGIFDYAGQTVDGVLGTASDLIGGAVDTVGAGVNFVFDGAGEVINFLFGWLG